MFWGLIPGAAILTANGMKRREKAKILFLFIVMVIAGFLFASPKTVSDPRYILRVVKREMGDYVLNGNVNEVGGLLNHCLSATIYSFFYSGFPFAPVFFVATIIDRNRSPERNHHSFSLDKLLPCLIIVFFFIIFVQRLCL